MLSLCILDVNEVELQNCYILFILTNLFKDFIKGRNIFKISIFLSLSRDVSMRFSFDSGSGKTRKLES